MKKSKSGLKFFLTITFMIGCMAAVVMFSPLLLLSDISVNEAKHYTAEDIIRISGIEKGKNAVYYLGGSFTHLLNLRMGQAEARVENLPWIKTAEIRYYFPDKVYIAVTERNAVAWIRYMSNYLLIDEDGYVMEVSSELDEQYPEIRGVQLSRFNLGGKIETKEPEKITGLVKLLQSLEQIDEPSGRKLGEVLDWIDFPKDSELFLSLDGRITAKMELDDEITYHLSYLKELYYNYIKPEEKGMIDFFDDKYARFIAE